MLEVSHAAPIYARICTGYARAAKALGHELFIIDPQTRTLDEYISDANTSNIDLFLITNGANHCFNQSDDGKFIFEKIESKKAFIHHDASLTNPAKTPLEQQKAQQRIEALQRTSGSSWHFCIELASLSTLHALGISKSVEFFHASEFCPVPNLTKRSGIADVTFVGHVMSSFRHYPAAGLDISHHLLSLAYQRLASSTTNLHPKLKSLATSDDIRKLKFAAGLPDISIYQHLLHELTRLTMPYRGELLSLIADRNSLDIVGGDPSYGTQSHPLLVIDHPNIRYHKPTYNYMESRSIYAQSIINLNISSLQFDSAMNNRILDVIFSGGFLITDQREQTSRLLPELAPYSFDSPESMVELITQYAQPQYLRRNLDFSVAIYEKYRNLYSYESALQFILSNLSDHQGKHSSINPQASLL